MFNKLQDSVSLIGIIISVIIVAAAFYAVDLDVEEEAEYKTNREDEVKSYDNSVPIMSGWVSASKIDAMASPSESSEIINTLFFNDRISYTTYDDEWYKLDIDGKDAYVLSECISNKEPECVYYKAPGTTGFKSFMDHNTITNVNSKQYEIQNTYAITGEYGIRMVDNRYCIALGSYFNCDIGQYVDLILNNGTVIPCVLSEFKDDAHTDYYNIITLQNGCMSEFIVDINSLNSDVKNHGDISYCNDDWNSPVVSVRVYDKNLFE